MTAIPTTEECKQLWDEYDQPENIRQHVLAVNRVAMLLAKKLKEKGEDIDLALVNAASLLHDLDKIHTLGKAGRHGIQTQEWLSERGHEKVGEVVSKHLLSRIMGTEEVSWEDKILNYADKRCLADKIVSIKERFAYLKKKYPDYFQHAHEVKIYELEKEIFKNLDITPDDIK